MLAPNLNPLNHTLKEHLLFLFSGHPEEMNWRKHIPQSGLSGLLHALCLSFSTVILEIISKNSGI